MAVAARLFELEQVDAELERREAELLEARRAQARNPELDAAEARLQDLRAQERGANAEQRALEAELADLEAKIKRDETRLYGGQIVDSRELTSLERELERYRSQREALEERLLLAMERLEEVQTAVAASADRVGVVQRQWEADKPGLADRVTRTEETLARLRAERESLAGSIDPQSLSLYQRLRASSTHAVSSVSNGVCQRCRVTIPPRDVQHARSGSLVTCMNCARILYVGS